jgi:hypothetical protein
VAAPEEKLAVRVLFPPTSAVADRLAALEVKLAVVGCPRTAVVAKVAAPARKDAVACRARVRVAAAVAAPEVKEAVAVRPRDAVAEAVAAPLVKLAVAVRDAPVGAAEIDTAANTCRLTDPVALALTVAAPVAAPKKTAPAPVVVPPVSSSCELLGDAEL